MNLLADTVTLIFHFTDQEKRLGSEANRLLLEADQGLHKIYLSSVSIMEILYLSEGNRIGITLDEFVEIINKSENYIIIPLDTAVIKTARQIQDIRELHDRMIAATALHLGMPMITSDREMRQSKAINTIW